MNWISNLWGKNKFLFFILIPVIILVFFKEVIIEMLIGSAKKMVTETKQKDADLRVELEGLKNKANNEKKEADKIDDKINNVDDDPDWHKK